MDSLAHELAQRRIDHPLPLDTRLAFKKRAFDAQREVAFAGGVVAGVSPMLFAVVDKFDPGGRERRIEPPEHLARDRSGFLSVHCPYIEG